MPEPLNAATIGKKHKLTKNKKPTVVEKLRKLDEDKHELDTSELVPTNENIATEEIIDEGKDNLPSSDDTDDICSIAKIQHDDLTTDKPMEKDVVTNGETCKTAQPKKYHNKIHLQRFLAKKNKTLENRLKLAEENLVTPIEPPNTAKIPAEISISIPVSPAKCLTPEKQVVAQINKTPDKELITQLNKTPSPDEAKPVTPKTKLGFTNLASPIAETIKSPDNRDNHTVTAAKVVNNKSPEKQRQPVLVAKRAIDNNVLVNQEGYSKPHKPKTKIGGSNPINMEPSLQFPTPKPKLGRRRLLDPSFACPYCGR